MRMSWGLTAMLTDIQNARALLVPWRMSGPARALLGKTGSWRIVTRYHSGLLLQKGKELLFVGTDKTSSGPFNIQLSESQFDVLCKFGDNVICKGDGVLHFGSVSLVTTNTPLYTTRAPVLDARQKAFLKSCLADYLSESETTTGFGSAPFTLIASLFQKFPAISGTKTKRRQSPFYLFVEYLVGHGQGATPSGDDFLVGMMAVHDEPVFQNEVVRQALLKDATVLVSQGYYRAASDRHFDETVVLLMESAMRNDRKQLYRLCDRIKGFGHSSGIDLLTGILFGLCVSQKITCASQERIRI